MLPIYNAASDWPRTFLYPGCFCLAFRLLGATKLCSMHLGLNQGHALQTPVPPKGRIRFGIPFRTFVSGHQPGSNSQVECNNVVCHAKTQFQMIVLILLWPQTTYTFKMKPFSGFNTNSSPWNCLKLVRLINHLNKVAFMSRWKGLPCLLQQFSLPSNHFLNKQFNGGCVTGVAHRSKFTFYSI